MLLPYPGRRVWAPARSSTHNDPPGAATGPGRKYRAHAACANAGSRRHNHSYDPNRGKQAPAPSCILIRMTYYYLRCETGGHDTVRVDPGILVCRPEGNPITFQKKTVGSSSIRCLPRLWPSSADATRRRPVSHLPAGRPEKARALLQQMTLDEKIGQNEPVLWLRDAHARL